MPITLTELFRRARRKRGLSQVKLAAKLGLRQSQISDLERAAVDSRLSTVRDVARALDLELMLIPRTLIPTVEGLLRGARETLRRPLYSLDEPEHDGDVSGRIRASGARTKRSDRLRRSKPKSGAR
jgi:transcriptional regulator with XRE-family HTH domain